MDDTEEEKTTHDPTPETDGLQAKCDEYLNGWKRAQADLANFRAGESKRFEEFATFAQEGVLRDLVAVLDSFALAGAAIPETDTARKGLDLIRNQLEDTLRRHGLEKIPVKRGDPFDPVRHEAIAMEKPPEDGSVMGNAILEEVGSGYTFRGKTIRPARVKITE